MSENSNNDDSGWGCGCLFFLILGFIIAPGLFRSLFGMILVVIIVFIGFAIFGSSDDQSPSNSNSSSANPKKKHDEKSKHQSTQIKSKRENHEKSLSSLESSNKTPLWNSNRNETTKNHTSQTSKGSTDSMPARTSDEVPSKSKKTIDKKLDLKDDRDYFIVDQNNSMEIYLHTFIEKGIKKYNLKLNSEDITNIEFKGQFKTIYTIDDLALYCAMLHDTITDFIITITNGISSKSAKKYLTDSYLDHLFPSFQHYVHRYVIETKKKPMIEFHKQQLLHYSDNEVLNNIHFERLLLLFLKVDNLARNIGKKYERIVDLTNGEIYIHSLWYDSFMNIATELVMTEVIYTDENVELFEKPESLEKEEPIEITKQFNVAGVTYREEVVSEALDYLDNVTLGFEFYKGYTDKDIKTHAMSVFKYEDLETSDFQLVPEPDNEYDSYAVKVIIGKEHHVGYVPKEVNQEIFDYLTEGDNDSYSGTLEVVGGPMKRYDFSKGEVVTDTSLNIGFKINLEIIAA